MAKFKKVKTEVIPASKSVAMEKATYKPLSKGIKVDKLRTFKVSGK